MTTELELSREWLNAILAASPGAALARVRHTFLDFWKGARLSREGNGTAVIESVEFSGERLALIVRSKIDAPGVSFLTEANLSQQLAYISHPAGTAIAPHFHNPVPREVLYTQEVLLIRKGRLRVDFYTDERKFISSRYLCAGDVILLIKGGHGFSVLDDVEMFEVKQGPYIGEQDKTRFDPG
jgi:hypothetical protein